MNLLGVSPPAQVPIPVYVLSDANICRSCLVMVDPGVKVCPFCGTNQTLPAETIALASAKLNLLGVSPAAQVPIRVRALSDANTCWSCLVMVDPGVTVCPLCGANQIPPAEYIVLEPSKTSSLASVFLRWALITTGVACVMGAILWYVLRDHAGGPLLQAEAVAAKTLTDVRSVLSEYALTANDKYPSTLEEVGGRAGPPIQEARKEGYEVVYTPKPSDEDGTIVGFTLVARAEKPKYRSFYIDASGILRATHEDRPANNEDPPF